MQQPAGKNYESYVLILYDHVTVTSPCPCSRTSNPCPCQACHRTLGYYVLAFLYDLAMALAFTAIRAARRACPITRRRAPETSKNIIQFILLDTLSITPQSLGRWSQLV